MTCSQQDPPSRLSLTNDMASCRGAQDAILSDQQLLDAVCSSNASNELDGFGVVESAITTDNKECVLGALRDREQDAGHEGLGVVLLLESGDLLPETRPIDRC